MFRDGAGESFVPHEVAESISLNANVPMYGFVDQYLGRGIVGGRLYGFGPHGEAAAGLVVKILTGTKPAELVPVEPANNVTMFDSRQLDRWKITRSRLPTGSEVRFHEPTLWEQYKWQLIAILFVVFGQTAIVVVLVRSLLRGRRLTRELKSSEAELLQNRVELKEQLAFESLESDISSTLMRVPAEELGQQIVPALRQTAQLLGFDLATLSVFTGNESAVLVAYVWHEPDTPGHYGTPPCRRGISGGEQQTHHCAGGRT